MTDTDVPASLGVDTEKYQRKTTRRSDPHTDTEEAGAPVRSHQATQTVPPDQPYSITSCTCYTHIEKLAVELRREFKELGERVSHQPAINTERTLGSGEDGNAGHIQVREVRSLRINIEPHVTQRTTTHHCCQDLFGAAQHLHTACFEELVKRQEAKGYVFGKQAIQDRSGATIIRGTIMHQLVLLSQVKEQEDEVVTMMNTLYDHMDTLRQHATRTNNTGPKPPTAVIKFIEKLRRSRNKNKIGPAEKAEGLPSTTEEALQHLLSLKDDQKRTPLALAAKLGSKSVMKLILNKYPYRQDWGPGTNETGSVPDAKRRVLYWVDELDGALSHNAVLERLVLRDPLDVVGLLSLEPLRSMVSMKWHCYNKWYVGSFLLYLIFMCVYTACAVFRPIGLGSITDMYQTVGDYFRLAGEVLVLTSPLMFLYGEWRDAVRHTWIWPNPTNRFGMFRVVNFLFISLTILVFVLRFTLNPNEDVVLPLALFLGWLNAISFLSAWRSCGMFPLIMHEALVADLLASFLCVYVLVLAAGTAATFCAYQTAPQPVPDFDHFGRSIFSLFQLTFGLLDTGYVTEARNEGIGVALFVLYLWFANILLLNLLIGMVADTYGTVREKYDKAWIWVQASHALMIERRLTPPMYTQYWEVQKEDLQRGNMEGIRCEGSQKTGTRLVKVRVDGTRVDHFYLLPDLEWRSQEQKEEEEDIERDLEQMGV